MSAPLLTPLVVGLLIALAQAGAEKGRVTIVGGTEAAPHSRPYMVSLQENGLNRCGGILIREDFVLTAAHCNRQYRVVLGAHSLHDAEPTQQILGIKKSFTHPDYNNKPLDNDVQLLKLDGKAKMTPAVQAIPLMTKSPPAGKVCSTAGWGDVEGSGIYPDRLQEVNATILSQEQCNKQWSKLVEITEHMVCATGSRRLQGFCSGDSGGPLVCDGRAAGIVSFSGEPCGDPRSPDVYMNIVSYKSWIINVLKRN